MLSLILSSTAIVEVDFDIVNKSLVLLYIQTVKIYFVILYFYVKTFLHRLPNIGFQFILHC